MSYAEEDERPADTLSGGGKQLRIGRRSTLAAKGLLRRMKTYGMEETMRKAYDMRIGLWRPALSSRAAAHPLLARVVTLALLAVTLAAGSLVVRPTSVHAQISQPELSGQRGTTTVQTHAQASVPRFDTFVRGYDGALWHRWWENGVWSNWENLGGSLDSAPAAGMDPNGANIIDVFYQSKGYIQYVVLSASFNKTRILDRRSLGDVPGDCFPFGFCGAWSFTSAPAVSTWPGRLDVFALADNHLFHRWYDFYHEGGWSDWELLSVADFAGDPAAVSWGPGRIDLFIHGADGDSLAHKVFDGHWHSWEDLGGTLLFSPTAASWVAGRLDVFVIGTDHQLWTRVFDNGQWSGGPGWNGWWPLGGYFIASAGASSLGPGALDVVGLGHDYQLYHSWWGGQWSPWAGIGLLGTFTSAPAVVDSWVTA
jgi:hypothetical protein